MSTTKLKFLHAVVGLLMVGSSWAQTPNTELESFVQKMKPRAELLNSANDLTLQVALPPQYSQCLHAAFSEAQQQNNVAHRYLLEQIDFLVGAGLTGGSIQALVAYGHAITNVMFASELRKSIDKLEGNDFKERQKYIYRKFTQLACVNTFSDERVQPALQELIKSTRALELH